MERKEYLIIILHEIYGINPHIKQVSEQYLAAGYDVLCPNFVKTESYFDYSREADAYRNFSENIGFQSVTEKLEEIFKKVRKDYKKIFLLGFSAGATAAWICSGLEGTVNGVICYYGSRIRDYRFITPKCPVLLIWANYEESFNVLELSNALKAKSLVGTHILNGKHGFSDPFCKNHNEKSQKIAQDLVDGFLKRLK